LVARGENESHALIVPPVSLDPFRGVALVEAQQRIRETILLVEDEPFVRYAAAEILKDEGYTLMIASTPAEALEVCGNNASLVDLLLTDIVMPGMNGHELSRAFATLCPHAQVLLMSGYTEQLDLCELAFPGSRYLPKPFSMGTLLRSVREALDRNRVNPTTRA
jgi:CheY-like chemotaxis protein